ncbi:hypothetical protein L6452_01402 [Arctium lappa]|uniref:Uncharacterized protein n=1 Tax=Arctium lappa TaxID=4217 RepID=A0ACB9FHH1_ARCLA|nr:hypothetical protein L6452_01402 [Arctium lappa]
MSQGLSLFHWNCCCILQKIDEHVEREILNHKSLKAPQYHRIQRGSERFEAKKNKTMIFDRFARPWRFVRISLVRAPI